MRIVYRHTWPSSSASSRPALPVALKPSRATRSPADDGGRAPDAAGTTGQSVVTIGIYDLEIVDQRSTGSRLRARRSFDF